MSKADKPVAKSLHTITVIVQVARLFIADSRLAMPKDKDDAVAKAMETLGLAGREDPYGLAATARKQLG